jgi:hypothetical protein
MWRLLDRSNKKLVNFYNFDLTSWSSKFCKGGIWDSSINSTTERHPSEYVKGTKIRSNINDDTLLEGWKKIKIN